ncbi:MAG TPA: hypothetical protein VGO36_09065 [Solirubrobacterales bacterium]|jgi:hypothetical protein|nr:hypothetical protein [Solirubrobacterales bacterium]
MAPPSPARLYATLGGAALLVAGIAGFFFSLSWLNFLYVASGALGLFLAPALPRAYALCFGLAYLGLAIWGLSGHEDWQQWPQLALGLLGIAAFAGTPKPARKPKPAKPGGPRRPSEARAQAAGKSA